MHPNRMDEANADADLVHHPACALVQAAAQLRFVRSSCSCEDHGGPVTYREFKRMERQSRLSAKGI